MTPGSSIGTTNAGRPSSNSRYHHTLLNNVNLWDFHVHADVVGALSWIFIVYFLLIKYGGWVGNETSASDLDRKYICYPAIFDTLFSHILMFFQLTQIGPLTQ